MALNGEEGRRRTNTDRVERSTAASETSLETYVRVRGKASGGQGRGDGMENRDQKGRARGWRPRE